ncbi:WSCD family member AAEL009094 [Lingula anatina]|uniref:WSCD family member AAEL009094 n=1 Tax=Lingula anatina TaxID=7574 RepID=A0A1S3I8L7_LINAN|nr:WSCD family member AAEL009094 [Lingula anatina]|eukprot:XP_013394211.1 WSCD family member AAEL009094 [Lingula anatina]
MKSSHKAAVFFLIAGSVVVTFNLNMLSLMFQDKYSLPLETANHPSNNRGHARVMNAGSHTAVEYGQRNKPKTAEIRPPGSHVTVRPWVNIQRPGPVGMSPDIVEVSLVTRCTGRSRQLTEGACSCVHFTDHNLPLTILQSFPGAGNTWVRHLLQEASGIFTGSVYNDVTLREKGFLGEGRVDPRVIAIKSHYPYRQTAARLGRGKVEKVVLLMRRLEDAVISEWNRQSGSHTGFVSNDVQPKAFEKFVRRYVSVFCDGAVMGWIRQAKVPMFVLRYEALKKNLGAALSSVLAFLESSVSAEQMQCVVKNSEGKFHRNHNSTGASLLTGELKKLIKDTEDKIKAALRQRRAETPQHTCGHVEDADHVITDSQPVPKN